MQLKLYNTTQKRILGLDIVRVIAILSVLFSHISGLILINNTTILAILYLLGVSGVELFFVLSGFLIGNILMREYNNDFKIGRFWVRRWMRTLPVYFAVLILYFIFVKFDYRYLIFTQNFISPHPGMFDVAWSLSVEEWFYLCVPITLLISKKIFNANKKNLFYTLVFLISIATLMRMVGALDYWGYGLNVARIVLFRFDAILYGFMIAYLTKYHNEIILANRKKLFFCGLCIYGSMMIVTLLGGYNNAHLYNNVFFYRYFEKAFMWSFMSLGLAMLLPFCANIKNTSIKTINKTIVFISVISYSLYLTHSAIINVFSKLFNSYISLILYLPSCILLAYIMHKIIEMPFMKIRDKITK